MNIEEICVLLLKDIFDKDCWYSESTIAERVDIWTGDQTFPGIFTNTKYYATIIYKDNELTFFIPNYKLSSPMKDYLDIYNNHLSLSINITNPDSLDVARKWLIENAPIQK